MAENTSRQQWIDRYVREELTVEEITEFEEALMESSVMQSELEAVLGLREALLHEPDVIAQKPTGHSALLLDIELNSVSRQQQVLDQRLLEFR
jgi:tryptophan 2,3-dioxygenase